jgi:hypothetical protein
MAHLRSQELDFRRAVARIARVARAPVVEMGNRIGPDMDAVAANAGQSRHLASTAGPVAVAQPHEKRARASFGVECNTFLGGGPSRERVASHCGEYVPDIAV